MSILSVRSRFQNRSNNRLYEPGNMKIKNRRSRRRRGRKMGYAVAIYGSHLNIFFCILVLRAPRQERDGELFPAARSAVTASHKTRNVAEFFIKKSKFANVIIHAACCFDSRRSLSAMPSWRWTTSPAYFTYWCWDSSWPLPWHCSSSAIGRIRIKPTPK